MSISGTLLVKTNTELITSEEEAVFLGSYTVAEADAGVMVVDFLKDDTFEDTVS